MSRSKNSYMRSPRIVTLQPMAMPVRSLKLARDRLARVICAFWPEITARSACAPSSSLAWVVASPTPILSTILESFGTIITFDSPNWSIRAGLISSSNATRSRGR